jgi:two-component system KDP operon response regulator KdpE
MEHAAVILIIDDELLIRRAVKNALAEFSDRIVEAATGAEGLNLAAAERPELIILDLGLPDTQGVDVCRDIRRWSLAPIIVLSARHSEQEKVTLLNAGADDYVTKPFSVLELTARVRAQLRRAAAAQATTASAEPVTVGGLTIDIPGRRVHRDAKQVHLTPLEWQILATLVAARGRTLTHQQIFDSVWGRQFGSPQQYLRVHITNLRRKIETDPATPEIVVTEPGVGYRVELPS